jgi:hypothetical protein
MNKTEALRLADELEAPVGTQSTYSAMQQAAAELRRLHADAQRYYWVLRHYGEFHGDWTLAALQRRAHEKGIGPGLDGAIDAEIAAEFADAAIKAVEETK